MHSVNIWTQLRFLLTDHCWFAQPEYSIEEGASKRLTLILYKPASTSMEVVLEMSGSSEIFFRNGG